LEDLSFCKVDAAQKIKLPVLPYLKSFRVHAPADNYDLSKKLGGQFPKLLTLDMASVTGPEGEVFLLSHGSVSSSVESVFLPTERLENLAAMSRLVTSFFPNLKKLETVRVKCAQDLASLKMIFANLGNLRELCMSLDEGQDVLGNVDGVLSGISDETMAGLMDTKVDLETFDFTGFQEKSNLTCLSSSSSIIKNIPLRNLYFVSQ